MVREKNQEIVFISFDFILVVIGDNFFFWGIKTMCIWSSNITSMREVDVFFLQDHKFCKKMLIGLLGAAIAKLHRLEAPPTDMHALTLPEAVCLRVGAFQGLFLMRSLCFAYRWCSLPLYSYSCLFCRHV